MVGGLGGGGRLGDKGVWIKNKMSLVPVVTLTDRFRYIKIQLGSEA